jgi:hypothetical protein
MNINIYICIYIYIYIKGKLDNRSCRKQDSSVIKVQYFGYFIVGVFCYICSFLLFVRLFFFTYALLPVVYVSHVEDTFLNILRL